VTPTLVRDRGEVTVAVASQYTDMSFDGELTVLAPDGWSVEPEERPVSVGPGGHSSFPLEITPPEGAEPGLYFVRVQLRVSGGGGGGGAVVEDVVSVLIGGEAAGDWAPPARGDEIELGVQTQGTKSGTGRATGLDIVSVPAAVTVAPGERARLAVGLVNRTRSRIDGEAMPVSPWGTWEFVGPYATGFGIEAGAEGSVEFEVDVPIDAEPGHWWVMVKLMWFGRAQYTEAVPVVVR
jgi:alpha-mannosidase